MTKRSPQTLVPWGDYAPLLRKLRDVLNCSEADAMRMIGYAGGSHLAGWKREGVPIIAMNATNWILHQLAGQETLPEFTDKDMHSLLEAAVAAGAWGHVASIAAMLQKRNANAK